MKLDEYQEAATDNSDEKVLLVAPPGSGKTTVLIEKIKRIAERGTDPKKIMVLTFSRSAAENIKKRVRLKNIEGPFFGTIHSLAYRYLKGRQGRKLITGTIEAEILGSFLKKYHIPPSDYPEYLGIISSERVGKKAEGEYSPDFIKELKNTYERGKKEFNVFDFDDLMEEFNMLLDEDEGKGIKKAADYILVDEFQDLNGIQLKIIKKLSESASLFCVGDEDQCIYSFRGSETRSMVEFDSFFPGGKKLYLKYNYRSSLSVINYANSVIEKNILRNDKKILSHRKDLKELEIIKASDEKNCLQKVFSLIEKSSRTEKTALLFRTNGEMDFYMEGFIKNNLPFSVLGRGYNFFKRRMFLDILSFFRAGLPTSTEDFQRVIKILGFPRRLIEKVKYLPVISVEGLRSLNLKGQETEKLVNLLGELRRLRKKEPSHAADYVFYIMNYIDYVKEMAEQKGRDLREYVEDYEVFRKRIGSFRTITELEKFIVTWDEIMSSPEEETGRIIFGTLHAVKGMEFDRVIIMNAVEGVIPHEKSGKDLEGERRLFYVGITRAENELYIMVPESIGGKKRLMSKFIDQ